MTTLPNINEIQELLAKAQEVLIVTHENPTQDSLGASLALFLSLSAAGKKASLVCSTPTTVEFSNLVGIDKVNQELGGRNFVISLDYTEGTIEKVSYNINDNKFNLIIEPQPGAPAFTPEKVHYSNSAASPDLIFVIDTVSLEGLGKLYEDKDLFAKVTTINIDSHNNNARFGKINLIDPEASSTSEVLTFFLQNLGSPLSEDIAGNLLIGIEQTTHNFAPGAGAGSFEAAAICLKAGGKRGGLGKKGEVSEEAPADWLTPKIFKSGDVRTSTPPKDGSTLL